MIKRAVALSIFLVIVPILFALYKMTAVAEKDIEEYQAMIHSCFENSTQTLSEAATQVRRMVTKDIWFAQEDHTRLHNHLESSTSILLFKPEGKNMNIIEKLQNVRCWMQEKLIEDSKSPYQLLRFVQAAEGEYSLSEQSFTASKAKLALFRLPGKEMNTSVNLHKAFLQGDAESINFSISEKAPKFVANQFKASLQQEGEVQ
ncbi:MAG: hypothetical protein EBZ47_02955 [Chlamydiae bacterium]|nr:hypothetical protein [Chlamydiota bacterium]